MGIQETFAHNMRTYRKQAHLTQEELAERSGLHRTYIGGIEQLHVNVSLKNVARIADAIGIEPALLFLKNVGTAKKVESEGDTPARDLSRIAEFKSGDYALCSWTDDGITLEPIEVHDEDLSLRILCTLAAQGHKDIVKEYDEVLAQIETFLQERGRDRLER